MKKKFLWMGSGLILALSTSAIVAFSSPKTLSPSDTITTFHDLAENVQVAETKEYVSTDILKAFENGGFPIYGSYGNFIEDYSNKMDSVTPLSETIKGESATVKVKNVYDGGREETIKYYLVKENGKWKIAE